MKPIDIRATVAGATLALTLVAAAQPTVAWANPPPHAPAHGWRKQHDPYYLGYTGKRWENDFGIVAGRCDRAAVGAVLGGVLGGAIGSQVGSGDGRPIAILLGTVVGAVLGAEVARRMSDADRACLAHGLELAPEGRPTRWDAPESGLSYTLIPHGRWRNERDCREFTLIVEGAQRSDTRGVGCRRADGSWELRGI
jgi:surface antigen